ncbi:hypothetical protein LTR95_013630 [Oleoguttula sp. CCFEE 5521]
MAQRKDMRRDDLIVPYSPPKNEKEDVDMQSTMASTLPMAAVRLDFPLSERNPLAESLFVPSTLGSIYTPRFSAQNHPPLPPFPSQLTQPSQIFTCNKLIGWTSVLFAIQAWLSETPASKASSTTPAIMSFGMAMMGVGVAYLPLFLPPAAGGVGQATPAGAAAPQAA